MKPVNVELPPQLRGLVLSDSQERYFGLHWATDRDELWVTTPRGTRVGSHRVYLAFHNHPRNFPALRDHKLGSSDQAAQEMLILDWQERLAYVAALTAAQAFFSQQPSSDRLVSEQTSQGLTLAAALVRLDQEARGVEEMSRWLDDQMYSLPCQDRERAQVALLLRRLQGGAV